MANYAAFVGARYSFSRKRNRFTSLIATISMLGMVLGVASLIVVLSIMNGFAGELRGRILSLVPHGYVASTADGIADWSTLREQLLGSPAVLAASPYVDEKVILAHGQYLHAAQLTGISPELEVGVSKIGDSMVVGSLDTLSEHGFNIVLGAALARMLNVVVGDYVDATIPRLTVTPLGVFPRTKRLRVVGIFEVGAQPDVYQAYVPLSAAQKLLGYRDAVEGLQLRTPDLESAPRSLATLAPSLPQDTVVRDWSQTQGSLFRAVKLEKLMVSLLLLSVVAVAAFNIVSTLVMSVTEKRRDIAVLRTMGARANGILMIFLAHGLLIALVGISVGVVVGVLLALNVAAIVRAVEGAVGIKIFDPAVYFISELPAQLLWSDVAVVVMASLVLSLLATLYPAVRAARVAPAEVLRYE